MTICPPSLAAARTPHNYSGGNSVFFIAAGNTSPLVLSNGGFTASYNGVGSWLNARISDHTGALSYTISGKRYFEIQIDPASTDNLGFCVGFIDNALVVSTSNPFTAGTYEGESINGGGLVPGVIINGVQNNNAAYTMAKGDIRGIAIDGSTGKCFFSLNNTWIGTQNPVTGANPAFTLGVLTSCAWITTHDNGAGQRANYNGRFSAPHQAFSPPSGYVAWDS